jgi:hypothetical protein
MGSADRPMILAPQYYEIYSILVIRLRLAQEEDSPEN